MNPDLLAAIIVVVLALVICGCILWSRKYLATQAAMLNEEVEKSEHEEKVRREIQELNERLVEQSGSGDFNVLHTPMPKKSVILHNGRWVFARGLIPIELPLQLIANKDFATLETKYPFLEPEDLDEAIKIYSKQGDVPEPTNDEANILDIAPKNEPNDDQ